MIDHVISCKSVFVSSFLEFVKIDGVLKTSELLPIIYHNPIIHLLFVWVFF